MKTKQFKPNKSGTPCMWCRADLSKKWIEHGGGWSCSEDCSKHLDEYAEFIKSTEPDE